MKVYSLPIFIGIIFATTGISWAEEKEPLELDWKVGTTFEAFTAPDGKRYEKAKITRLTPAEITLMHSGGVARVAIADLPEEFQAALGFDPEKAAGFEAAREAQQQALNAKRAAMVEQAQKQVQEKADTERKLASAKSYTFKVFQVLDQGILVREYQRGGMPGSAARAMNSILGRSTAPIPSTTSSKVQLLKNVPKSSVVDGDVVEVAGIPLEETYRYPTAEGGTSTVSVIEFVKWLKTE